MTPRMAELPVIDRPRERLKRLGQEALTSDELLAVILGSGSRKDPVLKLSRELILRFGSLQALSDATLEEMQSISGIGPAKALKLKAAFSLARRCSEAEGDQIPIKTPQQAFEIALPYVLGEKKELFLILLLNVRMRLMGVKVISVGTLTETLVHPREVFYQAIRHKAHALVAVHNHPSGNVTPSYEDVDITKQLIEASKLMAIPLLDHLIISQNDFYSFRENGNLFKPSKDTHDN